MPKLIYIFCLLLPFLAFTQEKGKGIGTDKHWNHKSMALGQSDDSLWLEQKIDSLRKLSSSIDTIALKQRLDSLHRLRLPVEALKTKTDSIRSLLDVSTEINQELSKAHQQLNQLIREQHKNLQERAGTLTTNDIGQEVLGKVPPQSGLNNKANVPVPEGIAPIHKIEGKGIPELKLPETGISPPELLKSGLPQFSGGQQIKEKISSLDGMADKIKGYKGDLQNIGKGEIGKARNMDKLAEEQLLKTDGISLLQKQQGALGQNLKKFPQDGKTGLKKKATEEAIKVAKNHFAGHKDKLQAAQDELNKYKDRYSEVRSLKEMPKNPFKRNPLKGKPWQERVIIGSIWQFSKGSVFKIDLGPTLAWRVSDKIEAGASYQWRLAVDKHAPLFLSFHEKVHGYSLFLDYKIKNGFFGRGTYTRLKGRPKTNVPMQEEIIPRKWMDSFELGIGKRYTFYKVLKGYSLVQYSFSTGLEKTYDSAIQIKIGFYINGKYLLKKR